MIYSLKEYSVLLVIRSMAIVMRVRIANWF